MIEWERKAAQATETCIGRCDLCKLVCLYDFASCLIEDIEFGRDRLEGEARRHWGLRRRSDGVDICSACRKSGRGLGVVPQGRRAGKTSTVNAILESAIDKERERQERFRAAMQGMANVMDTVWQALAEWLPHDLIIFAEAQKDSVGAVRLIYGNVHGMAGWTTLRLANVRAEWSRRVREGVKALRPPGPVVACQGDWEDD